MLVASFSGVSNVFASRINRLMRRLASTRAKFISLTAKLFCLEEARDKVGQEHEDSSKKALTESKTLEEHIVAVWDVALFRYHDVLRSI